MAKLTDREKKKIIAEYVEGNISQTALSKKHRVSRETIRKVLKNDAEFSQKVAAIKKENAETVLEHIAQQKNTIIDLFDETTKQLSEKVRSGEADVRELVGLFKTIIDTYANIESAKEEKEKIKEIKVTFEDASEGNNGT